MTCFLPQKPGTPPELTRRTLLGLAASATLPLSLWPQPADAMTPIAFDGGWLPWTFRGIEPTQYGFGGSSLTIRAEQSSSVVYTLVPRALRGARTASWQWKVDRGVGPTDLTARGGDDRAIALYVVFVDQRTAERFGDETPSLSSLLGLRGGRTLIYVWGGSSARGAVLPSPYLRARGRTIVLRPAGTSGWTSESVDLAGDYARAFGGAPEVLVALGVSSDSDDTGAINEAAIRNLTLG